MIDFNAPALPFVSVGKRYRRRDGTETGPLMGGVQGMPFDPTTGLTYGAEWDSPEGGYVFGPTTPFPEDLMEELPE